MVSRILTLLLRFVLTLLLLIIPFATSMKLIDEFNNHPKQINIIPAMYVFGDSLVDAGNNNHLSIKTKANFLPYGIDFDRNPTGRYTNGKTVVDFFAIHLGLPFAPPYLGLSRNQRSKIITGINYASGGSGILPETNNGTVFTLDDQIKKFQRTVKNLQKLFDEKAELENHLSESLFVVSTGINDNFQNGSFRGSHKFALYLLNQFSLRLQRMYSLGARKFFINNIAPAGCFPSEAVKTRPKGKCNEKMNKGISFYNRRLPELLYELKSQLPGFTYVVSDLYKFFIDLRETANSYGITEIWKSCCPDTIHGNLTCHPNSVICKDRNKYLFFDVHPTQIANQIYTGRCFTETTICRPSSLKLF